MYSVHNIAGIYLLKLVGCSHNIAGIYLLKLHLSRHLLRGPGGGIHQDFLEIEFLVVSDIKEEKDSLSENFTK